MSIDPEELHVIRCYFRLPPLPGGMERHIAELTAAQRAQGIRVTEVYNSGEPTGEGIRVWPTLRLEEVRPSRLRWFLFYSALARSQIDLSDGRLPVMHAHGDWPAFPLATALGRRIGASAIAASLHGRFHGAARRYARALRACDPIFTTGQTQSRQLTEIMGRTVIHMPSAPQDLFFSPPKQKLNEIDVVAVGNLARVKNLDLLMNSAEKCPDLRFLILGDGPERSRLIRLASELRLKNVQFGGAASPEEVHSALSSARLFLNTSYSEGSPTAALEAMACGLPVVLTPSNDYSTIVRPGLNGIVTRGWNSNELVEAVRWFLDSPRHLGQAKTISRAIALEHRWHEKAKLVTDAMIMAIEKANSE